MPCAFSDTIGFFVYPIKVSKSNILQGNSELPLGLKVKDQEALVIFIK